MNTKIKFVFALCIMFYKLKVLYCKHYNNVMFTNKKTNKTNGKKNIQQLCSLKRKNIYAIFQVCYSIIKYIFKLTIHTDNRIYRNESTW